MFYKIEMICLLISKYAWDGSVCTDLISFTSIFFINTPLVRDKCKRTYVNIRSALSFNAGNGLFAHWNRNWRNSGHWLLPSSSIKFLATSAATSQTLRRILSVCSFWTDSKICSFNWVCASGGICEIIAYQIYLQLTFDSNVDNP